MQLKVTVTTTWQVLDTLLSDTFMLDPGMVQELLIPMYLPSSSVVAEQTISFELISDAQDENPSDNFAEKQFETSGYVMARDRGISEGAFTGSGDGFELGSFFHIENPIEINCIYVAVSEQSMAGTFITTVICDDEFNYLTEKQAVAIDSDNLNNVGEGNFMKMCLEEFIELEGGQDYFINITDFGVPDEVFVAVENEVEVNSSFFRDYSEGTGEWIPVNVKPLIRMGFTDECLYEAICIGSIESKVQVEASTPTRQRIN